MLYIENSEAIISFVCFSISSFIIVICAVGITTFMEKLLNTPFLKHQWYLKVEFSSKKS